MKSPKVIVAAVAAVVALVAGVVFAPAAGAAEFKCKGWVRYTVVGCRIARIGHGVVSPVADANGVVVEGARGAHEATEAAADVAAGAQAVTEVGKIRLEEWRDRERAAAAQRRLNPPSTAAAPRWLLGPDGRLCQPDTGVCVARTAPATTTTTARATGRVCVRAGNGAIYCQTGRVS